MEEHAASRDWFQILKAPSDARVSSFSALNRTVVACRQCPRLVRWRETVSQRRVKRHADEEYWGRPVPGFGDIGAHLLIVGLAPGAHGANRTGRMFTGDRSGLLLYRVLHKAGFASRAESMHRTDGLTLSDCYITAAVRCVPPENKPTQDELFKCRPFLLKELAMLKNLCVVVALGKIGFDAAVSAFHEAGRIQYRVKPGFAHAAAYRFADLTLIASYHPSQQNTFTGRLTEAMLEGVFRKARVALTSQAHTRDLTGLL